MGPGSQMQRHDHSACPAMSAEIAGHGDSARAPAAAIVASDDSGSAAEAAPIVRLRDGRSSDYLYPGGKSLSGVPQWIVSLLPTHVFYAEPFCGKGGVFRHKPPALRSYLIDCDPAVIAWWQRRRDPGTIVHLGDGIRWIELAAEWAGHDTLIYVDPPYLLSTRTKKRIYSKELSGAEHGRLLYAARRCRCAVAISGYPSRLYDQALHTWHRCERPVITRGGTMRTEVLWTNYDPGTASPAVAMEYSALGTTFRERERVARKIKRWVDRMRIMPRYERRALLLSLLDAERGPHRQYER